MRLGKQLAGKEVMKGLLLRDLPNGPLSALSGAWCYSVFLLMS